MRFNALSLAKLGVGFGALAVASIGLLAPTPVEAVDFGYIGGWQSNKSHVEKERIRLGITKEDAKTLKRIFRLADKKQETVSIPDALPEIKQLAEKTGLQWEKEFGIWLGIINNVRINARDNAAERLTLQAFEVYEQRRMVEIEEMDIVFMMTVLATEIYA